MKAVKKTVTIVISIVLWIIILTAALFAFTTMATRDQSKVASIAGYTPMVVRSDSMSPTFNTGDLIIIRKCDTADLKEGDIITFHTIIENEYALNTHRIVEIQENNQARSYTTRGDNNAANDSHIISDGDIVGKYVGCISGLGRVMDFLSGSIGFLLVIVLPMLIFFVYQVYHLIMVSINLKKAIAAEAAAPTPAAAAAPAAPAPETTAPAAPAAAAPTPAPAAPAAAAPAPAAPTPAPTAPAPAAPAPTAPAAAPKTAAPTSGADEMTEINNETRRIQAEAEKTMQEAKRLLEEANAIKAQAEANAALAEAKRMKEEAAAILKQMKKED